MSFTPPLLGCLLKISLQKKGFTDTPEPRLTTPDNRMNKQNERMNGRKMEGSGARENGTNGEQMNERNEMKSHEKGETRRMEEQREPNGEGS